MNTTPRPPVDEREWQLQERALQEERDGASPVDDRTIAQYRQVARALRRPLPPALPDDFAARVAARALHPPPDTRLEQLLTNALVVVMAIVAVAAAWLYGGEWLRESLPLLPPQLAGTTALNWGLALAACFGLSWSLEQLRRRRAH